MKGIKANGEKKKPYFRHTIVYGKKGNDVVEYSNVLEAASSIRVKPNSIYKCCNGKKVSTGGYAWSYTPFEDYPNDGRIWKDVIGYEGLYQVSSDGCVRTSHDGLWKLLSPGITKHNYCTVLLHKDGKRKNARVHRLVAQAFIPNPDNLPYINHKDENGLNNKVDNLEWCTAKYNTNYGTCIDRISRANRAHSDTILQYDKKGVLIKRFSCISEIKETLNYHHSNISNCLKGKINTAYGYIWLYEKDIEQLSTRLSKRMSKTYNIK